MAYLIVIGTRGSRLARWQAEHVAVMLNRIAATSIVEIETAGDQVRYVPLGQMGPLSQPGSEGVFTRETQWATTRPRATAGPVFGEGIFTKEIQRALLDHKISLAVHSLKDLPTLPVEGLGLAAVPPRGPTGDVFVSRRHRSLDSLPLGAVVATGSLRRQAQILHRRPDLQIVPIRGNVETRLRKLDDEGFDGLILAQAGLERLGLGEVITEVLDPSWMLPAVGQGALALECRSDDELTLEFVRQLDHAPTHRSVLAERALLRTLQGGCQVPVGALGTVAGDRLSLRAAVLDAEGKRRISGQISGSADKAEEVGRELAQELLQRGARELLD